MEERLNPLKRSELYWHWQLWEGDVVAGGNLWPLLPGFGVYWSHCFQGLRLPGLGFAGPGSTCTVFLVLWSLSQASLAAPSGGQCVGGKAQFSREETRGSCPNHGMAWLVCGACP